MPTKPSKIAVLYLVRKAEGLLPVREFLTSYKAHSAGIDHDLVLLFKGFDLQEELLAAREEFLCIPHISIEMGDEGFDLGSYFTGAQRLEHEYICCLNTFTKILTDSWLAKLYAHIEMLDVGLVGATGSYESISRSVTLVQKAIWLYSQNISSPFKKEIRTHFQELIPEVFAASQPLSFFPAPHRYVRKKLGQLRRYFLRWRQSEDLHKAYSLWWEQTRKNENLAVLCAFPPFPNPHIRTNAFMIKRQKFLSLHRPFITKSDVFSFESGEGNMTKQILCSGLKALVVGSSGKSYAIDQWEESSTFRSGRQENLLIQDNQTRYFAEGGREKQALQTLLSWGHQAIASCPDGAERYSNEFKGWITPP